MLKRVLRQLSGDGMLLASQQKPVRNEIEIYGRFAGESESESAPCGLRNTELLDDDDDYDDDVDVFAVGCFERFGSLYI